VIRLGVNIDHVATIRQARRATEPDPVHAAVLAELGGADGITVHLRGDRRHIQDRDVEILKRTVTTHLNIEMAASAEMARTAQTIKPHQVTLVPERREEVTTEGGLALEPAATPLANALQRLRAAGIRSSLFIDPDRDSVSRSRDLGADAVELHTGRYAHAPGGGPALDALRDAAALGASLGLAVHAGHGLTTGNVGPVAAIPEIEELNIGHHVISRAIFVGLDTAVRELRAAMDAARRPA
jgi:pyridoxine 5-phosphate synthase